MFSCLQQSDGQKRSRDIDKLIAAEKKKHLQQIKLLLLGPGESGKSTIFKQLKIIQDDGGFNQDELLNFKYIIYGNCVTQMKVLINAAIRLKVPYEVDESNARADRVLKAPSGGDAWTTEIATDIKELWQDPGIQKVYAMRDTSYQLNDSAYYFFTNIERYMDPKYVPSQLDVLRARVRSTGIEEAEFKFDGLPFRVCDVGGQRSERRKWIHCFDGVTSVLFCVGLSEYDQNLREDDTMNRMKESLVLFDEINNSDYFRVTPFILFLNKTDLFKEKLKRVDLKVCFPNYTGGDDFDLATQFVTARFLERNQASHPIYPHLTCAINTENVEFVFNAVRRTLLEKTIQQIF